MVIKYMVILSKKNKIVFRARAGLHRFSFLMKTSAFLHEGTAVLKYVRLGRTIYKAQDFCKHDRLEI